jgi:hypothetical protein
VTSPEARAKARNAAHEKKRRDMKAAQEQNAAHEDGKLYQWLVSASGWNDFARSLCNQNAEGREWSDKQVQAATRMMNKCVLKEQERAKAQAEREAAAPSVDLSRIEELFETAKESGYKKPSFRAEGLILKPAPATGRNAGAIYVMDDQKKEWGQWGETASYAGKVQDAKFHDTRSTEDYVLPALQRIAENPLEAALSYGRRTGRCACCGRELTKHTSIEAGIGPICAGKWGL